MIITTEFNNHKQSVASPAPRYASNASSASQREARLYREVSEYRGKMSDINSRLNAALNALADANREIDRLKAELAAERNRADELAVALESGERTKKARRTRSKKEDASDQG